MHQIRRAPTISAGTPNDPCEARISRNGVEQETDRRAFETHAARIALPREDVKVRRHVPTRAPDVLDCKNAGILEVPDRYQRSSPSCVTSY
jgi:hypothetical protein